MHGHVDSKTCIWLFLWRYLSKKICYLVGFLLVSFIWALEMSLSPFFLKQVFDALSMDLWLDDAIYRHVLTNIILYLCMSFLLNINFRFYNYISYQLFSELRNTIRMDMMSYLFGHSYAFLQKNSTGHLAKQVHDMSSYADDLIQIPLIVFLPRALALSIAMISMAWVVHPFFSCFLGLWTVCFLAFSCYRASHAKDLSHAVSKSHGRISGVITDAINNVLSIKIFSKSTHVLSRIENHGDTLKSDYIQLEKHAMVTSFIQSLCSMILSFGMFFSLLAGFRNGYVSVGDIIFVMNIASSFSSSVFSLGQDMLKFSKVIGYCNHALDFMNSPHDLKDRMSAKRVISLPDYSLQFRQVSYAYSDDHRTLDSLNFKIGHREKVGIVGVSGAGKSTILKLILRLMDPTHGSIHISGTDIRELSQDNLREFIAMIPQDLSLFHMSIMDNIRFSKPDASADEVIAAAKKSKCHDFISKLPNGYNTIVGNQGMRLSGGQRQRLAIARAVLCDAPILLLDEATSALDSVTEQHIQQSLTALMEDKTVVVVAHRLSTLRQMDRILLFENGNLIENGSFNELILQKKQFYKLWKLQHAEASS